MATTPESLFNEIFKGLASDIKKKLAEGGIKFKEIIKIRSPILGNVYIFNYKLAVKIFLIRTVVYFSLIFYIFQENNGDWKIKSDRELLWTAHKDYVKKIEKIFRNWSSYIAKKSGIKHITFMGVEFDPYGSK